MIEKEELFSVVPHRGRMLLLDRVKSYSTEERTLSAEYRVTEDCLFYDSQSGGVPAWAGFEFMAQAISALAGICGREKGEKPKIGFILSVSSMRTGLPFFPAGSTAEISVKEIARVDLVYSFSGEVTLEGKAVLEGKLTVMDVSDDDFQKFL